MGWGNSFFPLLIVTSSTGFTGLFVYSPSPGTGKLIASTASHAGTDPYGNAFLQGITTYLNAGATFYAININGNDLSFEHASGAGGPYTVDQTFVSSGAATVAPLGANALQLVGNLVVDSNLAALVQAYAPGFTATLSSGTVIETLHTITAGFPAGWSGTVWYWRDNEGVTPVVHMVFRLTIANGTVVTNNESLTVSVVSGYFLGTDNNFVSGQVNGGGLTGSNWAPMRVDSTGLLHYDGPAFTAAGAAFHYSAGVLYTTSI